MEERPLIDVNLDVLRHIFETFSSSRIRKPKIFSEITRLISRLKEEFPDAEVCLCLTGFSRHVDSTEFTLRLEKTGPGRRWKAMDSQSRVFHTDERRSVRIWFFLRIEGDCDLQYCTDKVAMSPWRKADEAGIAALISEAKEIWEKL